METSLKNKSAELDQLILTSDNDSKRHFAEVNSIKKNYEDIIAAEKETIRSQFEKLSEDFQSREICLHQKLEEREKDCDSLKKKLEESEASISSASTEFNLQIEELNSESKSHKTMAENLKTELKNLTAEYKTNQTELDDLKQRILSKNEEVQKLTAEKLDKAKLFDEQRVELENEIQSLKTAVENLEKLNVNNEKLAEKQKQLDDLTKKLHLSTSNAKKIESEVKRGPNKMYSLNK